MEHYLFGYDDIVSTLDGKTVVLPSGTGVKIASTGFYTKYNEFYSWETLQKLTGCCSAIHIDRQGTWLSAAFFEFVTELCSQSGINTILVSVTSTEETQKGILRAAGFKRKFSVPQCRNNFSDYTIDYYLKTIEPKLIGYIWNQDDLFGFPVNE